MAWNPTGSTAPQPLSVAWDRPRIESDPDVIDAAADKQLTFLHQLTGDEHAEEAESISNQVSIARLCLLNAEKESGLR